MSDDTLLVISGIGVPDFSARGLRQSLEPIDASRNLRRTVNGTLLDLSGLQFRKYRSVITCTDQQPPAIDGIFPGQTVTVDCVARLSYPLGGSANRPVVPGSVVTNGGFVSYRPRLTMLVTRVSVDEDEWGAIVGWTIELEER